MTGWLQRKRISDLETLKDDVASAFHEMEYYQRSVVWDHYIEQHYWERIAQKYFYSPRQCRNISEEGLKALGKLLENSSICKAALQWEKT